MHQQATRDHVDATASFPDVRMTAICRVAGWLPRRSSGF